MSQVTTSSSSGCVGVGLGGGMMGGVVNRVCVSVGCGKDAALQCPTCKKMGISDGSFFCSQDCFKGSWSCHKGLHKRSSSAAADHQVVFSDPWPGYRYSGLLRPAYPLSPRRLVPAGIGRPDYGAEGSDGKPLSEIALRGASAGIKVLGDEDIQGMRTACRLAREVLDEAWGVVGVGVTTDEIDRVVHEACVDRECYPSPLNYYGFPKSCCTSVNEVICHGIPDQRRLQDGDICNVDVTVFHREFHGDLNETFLVGGRAKEEGSVARKLTENTWECLQKAVMEVRPGTKYRDVGNVIQKHAQSGGFSVVRSYCGHGIHRLFHTTPSIPHYAKNKAVGVMREGHVFTIEPMISEGTWRDEQWPDDWTAVTADGKLSAQFEETLLVTETGVEVLTGRRGGGGGGGAVPYFKENL